MRHILYVYRLYCLAEQFYNKKILFLLLLMSVRGLWKTVTATCYIAYIYFYIIYIIYCSGRLRS